jgi:hypothetical protein
MKVRIGVVLAISFFLAGCNGATSGRLYSGQWTHPQIVGQNQILIQGYDTEDAINGARQTCARMSRSMYLVRLTPHTRSDRATVIFSCT